MTFRTFHELETYILQNNISKRIALCGAHDEPALSALIEAKRKGVAQGVLIEDKPKILDLLQKKEENKNDYTIIHEPNEILSAQLAVSYIKDGSADIPMKGLMQTSSFMRAVLNKEQGLLPKGNLLSECTVFEFSEQKRMVFASDCAVNITPSVEEKKKIIQNAARLALQFGIGTVQVAVISALETINSKIQSTVEAAELSKTMWPQNIIVEGPFALDNAISKEAAAHKGIKSSVAGKADILIMPDLCSANVLHKSLHFFAHFKMAGALCGTEHPVILTSRTDSSSSKYYSILTAILQAL